jgi:hypothetical protein
VNLVNQGYRRTGSLAQASISDIRAALQDARHLVSLTLPHVLFQAPAVTAKSTPTKPAMTAIASATTGAPKIV